MNLLLATFTANAPLQFGPRSQPNRVHNQHPNRMRFIHNIPLPLQTLLNGDGDNEIVMAKLKRNAKR